MAHLVAKGIGRDADKTVAVNAPVTGGSINEIVASAAAAVDSGYGTVKLKVGMQDLRRPGRGRARRRRA